MIQKAVKACTKTVGSTMFPDSECDLFKKPSYCAATTTDVLMVSQMSTWNDGGD